jgi:hypothetical protein
MKPRVTRVVLDGRAKWIILLGDRLVGFKQQTQFETFACACFLASCISSNLPR